MDQFKLYYRLTKPGIIYGNTITAVAGFLLASKGHIKLGLLAATLVGLSLVIASACVFNNYLDRDIDKKMSRTKKRALVTGAVPAQNALIFASVLEVVGFVTLALFTNLLTAGLALAALFDYVVLYGLAKRRTSLGTLVGSISGAAPPVIGYTAVTNNLDASALILFLILVFWQMPHFYAIAIYRSKDYKAAGLPVLPVKRSLLTSKINILLYVIAFAAAAISLYFYSYVSPVYLIFAAVLSVIWLSLSIWGFRLTDASLWARRMFFSSLIIITVLSAVISLEGVLG